MTGDAKEKAAAWGNTAALGTLTMPPDLKGYGDGVQRLRINAEIRKWFQKIRRRHAFSLVYVFFKCALA